MSKINCGILFNAKQNYFLPYLKWIIDQEASSKSFKISRIHTNDTKIVKNSFDKINCANSLEEVIEHSDIVFSLGYWRLIKKKLISKVPRGIINIHHSYKLKYKGRYCSTWALKHKEAVHGSTLHFIDEHLDEGKIIDTRCFGIHSGDTAEDIFFKANNLGLKILKENFNSILFGEIDEFVSHDKNSFNFKGADLSHEIPIQSVKNKDDLLREICSLTFDKKPAPYVILNGHKVFLKLESYDDGYLRKQKHA